MKKRIIFSNQSMQEILPCLQKQLEGKEILTFEVLNPDFAQGYAGYKIEIEEKEYLYRSYKTWVDLAELLKCKMLTPKESVYPLVTLRFQKLALDSFHIEKPKIKEEKYGRYSTFFQIYKMEEPAFLYYYMQALDNVKITEKTHVLNLGINRGDEFQVIKNKLNTKKYENMKLLGIDYSKTAISYAKQRFPETNVSLYAHDINKLKELDLENFDLLISIGTLQSPDINFKVFLMDLVQNYLSKKAAIILGFPNSRWTGGELIYGAKAPNYAMSEMSLLYNDVIFAKKYLQQHKFRVTLTGKYYVFLTATKIM
ncbi:MAG: methyltransferase [Epsilonproteobacteria bacterium]|nr:MAG: methyltransferase [Campylobacterota bacterium]